MNEMTDTEKLAQALRTIQYSMQQAQIPGNDSRREIKLTANICEQALAAHDSRAQPASVPDGRVRLAAIETKLRERGVVDVKFDFAKMDAPLSQVANDCADVLEAVLDKRTKKFTGLGDSPAQPASVMSGWKLVPSAPTAAMVDVCAKLKLDRLKAHLNTDYEPKGVRQSIVEEWLAMLAAAPQPVKENEDGQ